MPSLHIGAGYTRWVACASALILTLLPGFAAAKSVRVTGSVTDTTGAAISGADVTLQSAPPQTASHLVKPADVDSLVGLLRKKLLENKRN